MGKMQIYHKAIEELQFFKNDFFYGKSIYLESHYLRTIRI